MSKFIYCPFCANALKDVDFEGDTLQKCSSIDCNFIHYDNPIPVVCSLIPKENGIVLVQRGVAPFIGKWCLPRGFMKRHENPKAAARREVREETGLVVRHEQFLNVCNPSPEDYPLNQTAIIFLSRITGGSLQPGDDAMAAGVFEKDKIPDLCFRTDKMILDRWFNGEFGTLTGNDL